MAAGDDSSDLSSLSSLSPAPSEDEIELEAEEASDPEPRPKKKGILKFFSKVSEQPAKEASPPPTRKRSPSPTHEYVLADNPDIAFIVMFRSRFSDAFSKTLLHFGPQELERDIVSTVPGDRAELFLCAILGLLLNRKQDVKSGHYGRALEDAISSHKGQWANSWGEKSPLSGGKTFNSMDPTERLTVLRTLILWSLSSSDVVKGLIQQSYKQNRHEDDLNQPRAVQPWGSDGDKRRYFLIEGQDDSNFRVYRESNPAAIQRTWWSVAGSIEELSALAEKLETKDGGPKATKFASKIMNVIPRFEAGDEKRKRRDYRQTQKERFKRPEPGFSMYEGRTRGKRVKYTYSDEEEGFVSDSTNRRSARNTGTSTPADLGPLTTSSGRQIRAPTRLNLTTEDAALGTMQSDINVEQASGDRSRRSGALVGGESRLRQHSSFDSEEESEAEFGDDEEDADVQAPEESEDEDEFDEDEIMDDDDLNDGLPRSLVVKLSVTPPKLRSALAPLDQASNVQPQQPASETKLEVAEAPLVEMSDLPKTEDKVAFSVGIPAPVADSVDENSIPAKQTSSAPAGLPEQSATLGATSLAFRGSPEKTNERQPFVSPAVIANGH